MSRTAAKLYVSYKIAETKISLAKSISKKNRTEVGVESNRDLVNWN